MNFTTPIEIPSSDVTISHSDKVFSIGSCFAVNIGDALQKRKFEVHNNPLGTIFNPSTLFKQLEFLSDQQQLDLDKTCESQGLFYHYDFHHGIYGRTKEGLQNTLTELVAVNQKAFADSEVILITLGTAFVHRLVSTNEIVGNCHKQPSTLFTKGKLSLRSILKAFENIVDTLSNKKKVILTVSPVRHTKEGIAEDQWSKSLLRIACEEICSQHNNIDYFPSYEIMMDELRDYRWYEADMIHPNQQAREYIFDRFSSTYFSAQTKSVSDKVVKINAALAHKTQVEGTLSHIKHLESTRDKIRSLPSDLNFSAELEQIEHRIKNLK